MRNNKFKLSDMIPNAWFYKLKEIGCSCRTTLESVWTKSDSPHENSSSSPLDSFTGSGSESPDPEFRTDRVLIPNETSSFDEMVSLSTSSCACNKISNNNIDDIVIDVDKNSLARKDDKLESTTSMATSGYRRSFSGSLAIVKSSFNPQKDFRESMVEMIVENNIRASKDLEDLLACYLSLNSDEYHDLIIKVFKQIWFDLTETG
ncbi:hypothetical protein TSUD_267610 [Trifolium subterraneum]|uniref:Transcription repressor n=1 Tax=Trifolium subterraneum TaxID=3900 RepID=A0A2Z6MGB0_TRISU|nr:hypothetical protein TSUD_267610 [Trifolium subterraneum]